MLGGMLAGHDEGGGNVTTAKYFRTGEVDPNRKKKKKKKKEHIEEKQFVEFYGMSSQSANNKHFGGLKDYRSPRRKNCLYRGQIQNTVQDILGGIRSACTYAGAVRLKYLSKCTQQVNPACTQTPIVNHEK